jgi:hypothetical protein
MKIASTRGTSNETPSEDFDATRAFSFANAGEEFTFVLFVKEFGIESALGKAKRDHMDCGALIRRLRRAGILPQSAERWK